MRAASAICSPVRNSEHVLQGAAQGLDRVFGNGYFRKPVRERNADVDEVICAPFGDDPVLLSSVTITNRGDDPEDFRWIEYWGCQIFQFSFRAFIEMATAQGRADKLRLAFGDRFEHNCKRLDAGAGLLETKRFLGDDEKEAAAFQRIKPICRASQPICKVRQRPRGLVSRRDASSYVSMLAGRRIRRSQCERSKVLRLRRRGEAGRAAAPLDGDLAAASALLLERRFRLRPKDSLTLHFLYPAICLPEWNSILWFANTAEPRRPF